MQLERRALYNLLRMNWLRDQSIQVEDWQVEDYRQWSTEDLLDALRELDGPVTKGQFLAIAQQYDNPEDLTSHFIEEDVEPEFEDRIYLIVFELWRRWMPESPSLSIFCDELDHLIYKYDAGEEGNEGIQDAVASLLDILDEGADEGGEPREVLVRVAANCANDLESFLYDYIADQIDDENIRYAGELLEGFGPYVQGDPWFTFLSARVIAVSDIDRANEMLRELVIERHGDLELDLEMLAFLSQSGDRELFLKLAEETLPLLQREEDLQELLECVAQYYRCLDCDDQEAKVNELMEGRNSAPPERELKPKDPIFAQIRPILRSK